jgi:hypothetical protein
MGAVSVENGQFQITVERRRRNRLPHASKLNSGAPMCIDPGQPAPSAQLKASPVQRMTAADLGELSRQFNSTNNPEKLFTEL